MGASARVFGSHYRVGLQAPSNQDWRPAGNLLVRQKDRLVTNTAEVWKPLPVSLGQPYHGATRPARAYPAAAAKLSKAPVPRSSSIDKTAGTNPSASEDARGARV